MTAWPRRPRRLGDQEYEQRRNGIMGGLREKGTVCARKQMARGKAMTVVRHRHELARVRFLVVAVLVLCTGSMAHGAEIGGVYRDGQLVDTLGADQTISTLQSTAPQSTAAAAGGPASQRLSAAASERGAQFNTEKEFARHAAEVETLLEKIAGKLERGEAVATETDALLQEKETLLALDSAIRTRFAEREQELIAAGLPAVVLDRHRATVDNYEKNFQILVDNLGQIEGVRRGRRAGFLDKVKAAHEHLRQHKSKDPPRFLSGNSLPLESVKTKAPVLDISAATPPPGAQARLAAPLLATPPGPGDLNPTIDVQITQEVIDRATQLGNSPLKIYQHVRDNFRFEAYLGSRKGSRETLLVGSGNDYDLASLLIALLRAANIPSRYVAGTVLLSAEQAMSWLGVNDPGTAANLLATAGMQATAYTSGGQIVAIGFKHVWVRAYLPYGNYRAIPNDATGKTWVPLDPSFKSTTYPPAVDIPSEMGFNAEAFIDNYISTLHTASPVDLYLQQIQGYVTANHPELTYPEDVFRHGTITPDQLGLLPASLPYKVLSKDNEYTEVPANKRHQIRFHIRDDFGSTLLDRTLNLPEIASRRVTISYVAATPADQATIDFYGDLYSTPPDLIYVKPALKIDGTAAAVGGSIGAGTLHYSDMYFLTPTGEGNSIPAIYNYITAGTYQGIGIDTFGVAPSIFVPSQNGAVPDTDGLTGEKLYRTAMTYLDRVDRSDVTVAETMQMAFTTAVSEAIVENVVLVSYFFGFPVAWEWRGLIVDADRKIIGPFSVAGDTSKEKPFFVLTGADASISENRVFEDTYNEQAVSTIKILELASDMGVPACRIVTSIAADCPGLSQPAAVVSAINNALAQGHKVTIPRSGITYHRWSGTGYIDMDPATGAAGYIISGGQSGGATVDIWVGPWALIFDTLFRDICSITANITYPPPNDYFPYPGAFAGFFSPQPPHFDVDYTVFYCGDGSRVVSDSFQPHYQYPPGDYVFYAGWGTGATLPFAVFGVVVETPDDVYAPKDGDPITLNAKVVPRVPPGATFNWTKSGTGDGTLSTPNSQTPQFSGATAGQLTAKVEVANANGMTDDEEELTVFTAEIQTGGSRDSDSFMGKGYTGPPVAGDPAKSKIYYTIDPGGFLGFGGFTPKEVKLTIRDGGGAAVRTATLPNRSGEQQWDFDGKNDGGNFLDVGGYKAQLTVTAPNNKKVESNEHDLTVVEVTRVELLKPDGTAFDNNNHPTKPGGLRIFTGRSGPAAGPRNDKAKVRVTLSNPVPTGKLSVHLNSFDVNDPTGLINDNHGSFVGTPNEGDLSDENPLTDGDNTVEVDFTVTMQPGDNFKVFASTNQHLINNLTDAIVEANTNDAGATTDVRLMPLASDRLTVWRRVHVEADSMGVVAGNVISGNITAVASAGGISTVTTNQNVTETPTAANRFEHGVLKNGGHSFSVVSNTQGANFQVVVNNLGAVVPANGAFTLVDDDDFNSDDGANLDGDAGEDVTAPATTLVQDSDDGTKNVFAFAYVRPTYDVGDNNTGVAFVLNTPDGANEGALLKATYDFDQKATEADIDFWTVYLLGAYQMQTEEDGDPGSENGGKSTLGQVDAINGQGMSVFKETVREAISYGAACIENAVVAHEIGHLFNGDHADGALMNGTCNLGTLSFSNATLKRIRDIDHP